MQEDAQQNVVYDGKIKKQLALWYMIMGTNSIINIDKIEGGEYMIHYTDDVELDTWNLYNFINQGHINKFNNK